MGMVTKYYIGYYVEVRNKSDDGIEFVELTHCANHDCINFRESVHSNYCPECNYPVMTSMVPNMRTNLVVLPNDFHNANNDTARMFSFYNQDGSSAYLIPNHLDAIKKYGAVSSQFWDTKSTAVEINEPPPHVKDAFIAEYSDLLEMLYEYHCEIRFGITVHTH